MKSRLKEIDESYMLCKTEACLKLTQTKMPAAIACGGRENAA